MNLFEFMDKHLFWSFALCFYTVTFPTLFIAAAISDTCKKRVSTRSLRDMLGDE